MPHTTSISSESQNSFTLSNSLTGSDGLSRSTDIWSSDNSSTIQQNGNGISNYNDGGYNSHNNYDNCGSSSFAYSGWSGWY